MASTQREPSAAANPAWLQIATSNALGALQRNGRSTTVCKPHLQQGGAHHNLGLLLKRPRLHAARLWCPGCWQRLIGILVVQHSIACRKRGWWQPLA